MTNDFGYFCSESELMDHCDESWKVADLSQIIEYLDSVPSVLGISVPDVQCFICGENLGNGSEYHFDGAWMWPQGITHFIEKHHLRLSEDFLAHIRERMAS